MLSLYDHQKNLAFPEGNLGLCIFHDTGTGKTISTLNLISTLPTPTLKNIIVVVPNLTIAKEWEKENKNFNLKLDFITYSTIGRLLEMISQNKKLQYDVVVFDESHKIKNPTSIRTKQACKLASSIPVRVLLSATPITQNELDFIPQLKIASFNNFMDGKSFYWIRANYFRNVAPPTVRWQKWELLPKLKEAFYTEINKYSSFISKEKVSSLPKRTISVLEYCTSDKLSSLYKDIVKQKPTEEIASLFSSYTAITPVTIISVLHKLVMDDPVRIAQLQTLLSSTQDKTIVWTYLRSTYAPIESLCQKLNIPYLTCSGGLTPTAKIKVVEGFKKADFPLVLIASLGTLSEGVNLQCARRSIFYDLSYNYADIYQAESRNYRNNSPFKDIEQYFILSDLKFDRSLYRNYQNKLAYDPKKFYNDLL
jgi:SNF2 family DNA or RNA helicase